MASRNLTRYLSVSSSLRTNTKYRFAACTSHDTVTTVYTIVNHVKRSPVQL